MMGNARAGAYLRDVRKEAVPDLSLADAAKELRISRAMLGFIEAGSRAVQVHHFVRMKVLYRMTDEQEGRLLELLEEEDADQPAE